jgi:hypothetical protein
LKRKLSAKALAQLSQRIAVHYHLGTLNGEETREYIAFRLQKVGGAPDIFDQEAMELIYGASLGIPRVVNLLCDTALVYAYGESLSQIDAELVSQVIRDKEGFGLLQQEQASEVAGPEDAESGAGSDHGGQDSRIAALEVKVGWLQVQMEGQLAQVGQLGAQSTERLITELTALIGKEREKTERLLLERGQLLARMEDLENWSRPEPEQDSAAGAEGPGQIGIGETGHRKSRPIEPVRKKWYQRPWSGAK